MKDCIVLVTVIICITILAGLAIECSFRENRLYIEKGYTQAVLPGVSDTRWVKEK